MGEQFSISVYITLWIVVGILLLLSAFFSAAETAYTAVRKSKVSIEANKGSAVAKLIQKQQKKFGWTLSTILVLNNLVNIAMSTFTALLLGEVFSTTLTATIVSTAIITPVIVLLGEIIPKLLAKKYSYGYLCLVAYTLNFLNILLYPITYPMSKLDFSSNVTNTEKELHTLLDVASKEGVLEKREATLASNALNLDSITIEKIFVPKEKIISVKISDSREKILETFAESGHSRLPVLKKGKFLGIVLFKDFVYNTKTSLEKMIIPIPIVSRKKLANLALEKMRSEKSHIAFVGNTEKPKEVIGLVTIEDIIEELIGEVYDEHDKTQEIREIGLYKFRAVGSAKMKLLKKLTKINYEAEDEQTLKNWISNRINRKIKKDLKYTYKNKVIFKIVSNKNNEETIIDIQVR